MNEEEQMPERDLEKLLGGYATGTLTDEERKALFEAALHDQQLFNALADEQALKELLADPATRRRLLQALEKKAAAEPSSSLGSFFGWLRRPPGLAFAGTLATAVIAVVVLINVQQQAPRAPLGEEIAAKPESRSRTDPQVGRMDADQSIPEDAKPQSFGVRNEAKKNETSSKFESTPPARAPGARRAPQPPTGKSGAADQMQAARLRKDSRGGTAGSATPREPGSPSAAKEKPDQVKKQSSAVQFEETRRSSPARDEPQVQSPSVLIFLRAYLSQPVQEGPARDLYYARFQSPETRQKRPPESPSEGGGGRFLDRAFQETPAPQSEVGVYDMEEDSTQAASLGLRYSILKEGEDGTFREVDPDGPFRANDSLRVTVEVNEVGYLYVFRLGPRGGWTWVNPSGPLGGQEAGAGSEVESRKRYLIPGTGVLPLYGQPASNKMMILYARQPNQELQVFHPAVRQRREGDDEPSIDLEGLLSRARIETSTQPLVVERVRSGRPSGTQERAVYVVNPLADEKATIALEVTFPN